MNRSARVRIWWIAAASLSLVLAVLAFAGCSKDSNPPTAPSAPTNTSMTGVMVNGAENGRVNVTIATTSLAVSPGKGGALQASVNASATFHPIGGSAVNLTGMYDTVLDSISLAGGGYSVTTNIETNNTPPSTVGPYDGPNGIGLFGAVAVDPAATNHALCGTYQSNTTSEHGNLDFLISNSDVGGVTFSSLSSAFFPFEGLLTGAGTMRTVTCVGGDGSDSLSVVGMYDSVAITASGTWTLVDRNTMASEAGTWTVTECP